MDHPGKQRPARKPSRAAVSTAEEDEVLEGYLEAQRRKRTG